jgi:hypothetical protein
MISPPPDEMRTKTNLEHMQFAKRFGFAVVAAYCGCDVTFESDRELAITNGETGRHSHRRHLHLTSSTSLPSTVARHIVGTEYNIHMSPTDFMSLAWVGATASVVGSMPHLSVRQINSQIKVGLELLGLGEITGAPMFGNKYESADGTMVELPVWPNDKRYAPWTRGASHAQPPPSPRIPHIPSTGTTSSCSTTRPIPARGRARPSRTAPTTTWCRCCCATRARRWRRRG